MPDYDPVWGDYAEQFGIDMAEMADAASEGLLPPIPVNFTSTTGNISAVAFIPYRAFPEEGILYVVFQNGPYRFFDIPEDIAMGFEGAPSATAYFNETIKGTFDYEGM